MLFRKDATIRERVTVALANLQRNSYAMSMLRGKLEARINFILSDGGKGGEYQEMARVLDLVKNSSTSCQAKSSRHAFWKNSSRLSTARRRR